MRQFSDSHPALVFIEGNFERRAGNQGTAWGGLVDGFYRGKQGTLFVRHDWNLSTLTAFRPSIQNKERPLITPSRIE